MCEQGSDVCVLCDEPAHAKGWCKSHYDKWRRHGDPEWVRSVKTPQSFVCKVCSQGFERLTYPSRMDYGFCSLPCANAWRARTKNPMDNPEVLAQHGLRIAEGMAISPHFQEARARRAQREAEVRKRRALRFEARARQAQVGLFRRDCAGCGVLLASGLYCDECAEQRKRDQRRRWNEENPDYQRIYKRAWVIRRNGLAGSCSPDQARARYDFYGGRCAYCEEPIGAFDESPRTWHWDHVIPLSQGGTNWPANLRPSCADCNRRKCAKALDEWRRGDGRLEIAA